jgi:hypothetical protein
MDHNLFSKGLVGKRDRKVVELPRLRPPRPPGGSGVGFPERGGAWAEFDRIGVFWGEVERGV